MARERVVWHSSLSHRNLNNTHEFENCKRLVLEQIQFFVANLVHFVDPATALPQTPLSMT